MHIHPQTAALLYVIQIWDQVQTFTDILILGKIILWAIVDDIVDRCHGDGFGMVSTSEGQFGSTTCSVDC